MRKLALITIILISFISCKKEDDVDPRDKFTGTFTGTTMISVPDLDYYENVEGTTTITKLSDPTKIQLSNSDGTVLTAKVSGNSYVYDKYTEVENWEGETYTIEITGTGSIDGSIITESGSYKLSVSGNTYNGSWSCSMSKQ